MEFIELYHCECGVGTSIKIPISAKVAHSLHPENERAGARNSSLLEWDWYCLSLPTTNRTLSGKRLKQSHRFNTSADGVKDWLSVSPEGYGKVSWHYEPNKVFAINGFRVPEYLTFGSGWSLNMPSVIVEDPNGKMPIDLTRTKLTTHILPFESTLAHDIVRYACAFALIHMPQKFNYAQNLPKPISAGLENVFLSESCWLAGHDGITINNLDVVVQDTNKQSILSANLHHSFVRNNIELFEFAPSVLYSTDDRYNSSIISVDHAVRDFLEMFRRSSYGQSNDIKGIRLLVSDELHQRYSGKALIPKYLWRLASPEVSKNGWTLLNIGECANEGFDFDTLMDSSICPSRVSWIAERFLMRVGGSENQNKKSKLAKAWLKTLGKPIIPYEVSKRKESFSRQYVELAPYIAAVERDFSSPPG